MSVIINTCNVAQDIFDRICREIDFIGPLTLRIYLAPIFILAGIHKLAAIENVAWWFASLGIPAPTLMVWVAGLTELIGGILLLGGFAVRWVAIPLMFTMIVAATTAHWDNGWHVLPETELTVPWEWEKGKIEEAVKRKERAVAILEEHGNIGWLTEHGRITILKNGIEFAATYFIMLLVLMFTGAGNYISADYWIKRKYRYR